MCDYSLCGLRSRLAIEGEELIAKRFSTGTTGMAPSEVTKPTAPLRLWDRFTRGRLNPVRREVADVVCLPPGATLILSGIPADLCLRYGLRPKEHVRFTQLSLEAGNHRDAVVFETGRSLRIAEFRAGMRMLVLSLAGCEARQPSIEERQATAVPFYASNAAATVESADTQPATEEEVLR